MASVYVLNPRTTPVVIDEEGHLLPGGERGDVDDIQRNQHSVLIGALRVEDKPAAPVLAPVVANTGGEA